MAICGQFISSFENLKTFLFFDLFLSSLLLLYSLFVPYYPTRPPPSLLRVCADWRALVLNQKFNFFVHSSARFLSIFPSPHSIVPWPFFPYTRLFIRGKGRGECILSYFLVSRFLCSFPARVPLLTSYIHNKRTRGRLAGARMKWALRDQRDTDRKKNESKKKGKKKGQDVESCMARVGCNRFIKKFRTRSRAPCVTRWKVTLLN